MSNSTLIYKKYELPIDGATIALHRFYKNERGTPVFMIHGAIENGRIFFSKNGKGFGPYLAENGYDVFIIDMRGKGESTPKIGGKFDHSQTQQIVEDTPLCLKKIEELTGKKSIHLVTHSWGAVIALAYIARFPNQYHIPSMVFFAGKRRISTFSLKKFFMVDIMWNIVGVTLAKTIGYMPATKMGAGSDNEPKTFFLQMNKWVYSKKWIDQEDGFNYKNALAKIELPPTLYLTGIKDKLLGNPIDVDLLRTESNHQENSELQILGKNYGNLADYNHISILTDKNAPDDHFKTCLKWINEYN